ncbi:uncharacterized protein L201_001262 [Kwoniella dendrophila CBS 6074]|uniref:Uncharacterized protein n=1 Tax=Kwoniella dendrophila CBS 6074 TaxID=1295534 RepID=A0AAX4JLT3_9TREE
MGAVTTLTIVALIADVGHEHVAVATSCALAQAILQRELSGKITGPDAEKVSLGIKEVDMHKNTNSVAEDEDEST